MTASIAGLVAMPAAAATGAATLVPTNAEHSKVIEKLLSSSTLQCDPTSLPRVCLYARHPSPLKHTSRL